MGDRAAACPVSVSVMFRPSQIVSAQSLEAQAASIADIIGLLLPPVNFCGIASNYLKRLSIPRIRFLSRCVSYRTGQCLASYICRRTSSGFPPVLIQSYQIDTKATTEELLKNLEAKYYEVAVETHECEKDLLPYLLHGKDEIFAGLDEASADATYITVDNLWNSYPKEERFSSIHVLQ
ncbi:unnamed protein product [Arabidopsis lyrata]|nr:unnamed protein product [Arabidopsis lyrata]